MGFPKWWIRNRQPWLLLAVVVFILAGCATYYERNSAFQELVRHGDVEKAQKHLEKDKRIQKGKNRLLYLLNMGYVTHLQGKLDESNKHFNEADFLIEDYRKQYQYEALALISNPAVRPYRAEDFEGVFTNYFKALNYMQLNQYDEARVEARRINIRLQALNDKYKKNKNRYSDDAFAHILMGLTYDAGGDYNNAFIAYRNAVKLYEKDGGSYFGVALPEQLKKDLLRTAYQTGLKSELAQFEEKFGMKYSPEGSDGGDVVVFWQNGFGPVKAEWSINFAVVKGQGGLVTFTNEEYGLNFPFYLDSDDGGGGLNDLRIVRVAFPKYVERKPFYNQGKVTANGEIYPLQMAENVNEIAFKTLEDRFLREMANSLLRLAIKKATEAQLRKENETLGAIATVANALTEKADTRNWQTLPYAVHYARIPLKKGSNEVKLKLKSGNQQDETTFTFEGIPGKTIFFPYHSIESLPPNMPVRGY